MLTKEEERLISLINEQDLLSFLQSLVRSNSENPPGNEKETGNLIYNKLIAMGCPAEKHYVEGDRFNVIGTVEGSTKDKILLNGHMDTVKIGNKEEWFFDPFCGDIQDGFLLGRGAADMKSGLAAMIFALEAVLKSGFELKKGIMFTGVIDEEGYFKGTKALIKDGKLKNCTLGFVSEPTGLKVGTSLKGGIEYLVQTSGKNAHSAMAFIGDNAIFKMNKVIGALEEYNKELEKRMDLPVLRFPTVNVGKVHGGRGVTLVPDFCEMEFDRQVLPGESIEDVEKEISQLMQDVERKYQIDVKCQKMQHFNPWAISHDHPLVKQVKDSYAKIFGGEPACSGVNYYAEVEMLASNGIPSILFGPGDITLAHSPNEKVNIQEVIDAAKVYALLLYHYAIA
ncbi:MAG: M20 family metallopeptidase [Bacillota bacterium]|jgi:succinyl-diaminopimelate desuccinylase